jgi:ankyrin repeat protein
MLAAEKGNIEIISILLSHGIGKIDTKDSKGRTALFFAVDCDNGENTDLIL